MKRIILGLLLSVGLFAQAPAGGIQLTSGSPSGPTNVTVANVGITGNTFYEYCVVAVYNTGMSQPTCTTTFSVDTLSGSNYNVINWSAPPGGTPNGYWVARDTRGVFLGTFAVNSSILSNTTFSLNDQSNSLNAMTYVGIPTAIVNLSLDNITRNIPSVLMNNPSYIDIPFTAQLPYTSDGSGGIIQVPYATYNLDGNVTVGQINSGITIIPAVRGRRLRVVGLEVQAIGGNFGGCTTVIFEDTAGTPVVSLGYAIATLTQNTVLNATSASPITTYAWQGRLTDGQGLQIAKTGSACTTATSLNYNVKFTFN